MSDKIYPCDKCKSLDKDAIDLINRLQEEIKFLNMVLSCTKQIKAEAYKEFAERLDKEFSGVGTCNYGCVHHKTRKVLKELVGEDK